jgi:hypothetical protein
MKIGLVTAALVGFMVSPIPGIGQQAVAGLAKPLAVRPPMGWNSWDAFGTTIDETSFRASAVWIAKNLKPSGYEYMTIDEAWFDEAPPADGSDNPSRRHMDEYGRLIPAPVRFPSSAGGKGFAPLADYLHSLGLKFGIHVLNGIPKLAVEKDTPILGTQERAKAAANLHSTCQWNNDNWDLRDNAAGQAYYDSIVALYASWHVDLVKIDCIASRPYKGEEIRMFHEAIVKSGAPIVLSLSPGAAPLNETANMREYAQYWRISDDVWDTWRTPEGRQFPQGLYEQIGNAAKWLSAAGLDAAGGGHWPDSDMLPIGELRPSPGWGAARATRLTRDEQRTMMTLWAIVRSPLVYGGNPALTDAATLDLLTNPEVIAVDQRSKDAKCPVLTADWAVYTSRPEAGTGTYVAVFNRSDVAMQREINWAELALPAHARTVRDLWTHTESKAVARLAVKLAPHASILLRVTD